MHVHFDQSAMVTQHELITAPAFRYKRIKGNILLVHPKSGKSIDHCHITTTHVRGVNSVLRIVMGILKVCNRHSPRFLAIFTFRGSFAAVGNIVLKSSIPGFTSEVPSIRTPIPASQLLSSHHTSPSLTQHGSASVSCTCPRFHRSVRCRAVHR